ncbi:AAA family ATPase [Tengunoibacter tsumagoiensis]|uniref:Uncharacterized protein n=1 Tax=Tengunoibacter tsumagoiensis TaxID=2014871 RepID=A0A401ZTD0_9CHLR|nr:AAA family ATPase [Tengunoibacter tsumagoiensis]GCE10149.1 hypothetical protein KTT_00080 [Tengunoibacter tsumagoiensis]
MNIKVFVLGRPGSGKSTVARHLRHFFALHQYTTRHINDYTILQRMFREDVDHKRFLPTANNGFDAIDFTVLDQALHEVECEAQQWSKRCNLLTLEFARDNYRHAFRQFTPAFLRNAYVLFMDADLELCLQRVNQRVACSKNADDHPSFSSTIFRNYYGQDNRAYITGALHTEFHLTNLVQLINNTGPLEDCMAQVERFAQAILERELPSIEHASALVC